MKIADLYEDEKQDLDLQPAHSDQGEIRAAAYPLLKKKIEQLNKRAKKLGVPEIQLIVQTEILKPLKGRDGKPDILGRKEKYYVVKIEGETPKLAGWNFIATIQHKESGNVIRTVPGQENNLKIKQFYEAQPYYCDWCKKKRNRIDTFIVQNDNGEMKQVGRNCLKDFLGGRDPKAMLWYFSLRGIVGQLVDDAEERTERKGGRVELWAPVENVVAAAVAAVRVYGYKKSSGEAGYTGSTPHMVRLAVFHSHDERLDKQEKEWVDVSDNPTPADQQKANQLIQWFKDLPKQEKDSNTFLHNIDVILNSGIVTSRDLGYVVAVVPVHARAMEQLKYKAQTATKSNQWIGTVGQKIPATKVKVFRTRKITGPYGTTQIVTMEDSVGNVFVWFNNSANDLEEDKEYIIIGTIKKHDDFNGRKQTVLTRVKTITS